jgi:hypothetical protein
MRLPQRFTLVLRGDTERILERDVIDHGHQLEYLLRRLLLGEKVADGVFDPYFITVEIEEDMDQGDT